MLESMIIMIIAMGFILFLLAVEKESIVYTGLGLIFWTIVLAGSWYIEVPSVTSHYVESGMSIIGFAFLIIHIILILLAFTGYLNWMTSGPARPPY